MSDLICCCLRFEFEASWRKAMESEWVCPMILWWPSYSLGWHPGNPIQSHDTLPLILRLPRFLLKAARQISDWFLLLKGHPPLSVFAPLMQKGKHIGWEIALLMIMGRNSLKLKTVCLKISRRDSQETLGSKCLQENCIHYAN